MMNMHREEKCVAYAPEAMEEREDISLRNGAKNRSLTALLERLLRTARVSSPVNVGAGAADCILKSCFESILNYILSR